MVVCFRINNIYLTLRSEWVNPDYGDCQCTQKQCKRPGDRWQMEYNDLIPWWQPPCTIDVVSWAYVPTGPSQSDLSSLSSLSTLLTRPPRGPGGPVAPIFPRRPVAP